MARGKMRHLRIPVGVRTGKAMHEHNRRLSSVDHDMPDQRHVPPLRPARSHFVQAGSPRSLPVACQICFGLAGLTSRGRSHAGLMDIALSRSYSASGLSVGMDRSVGPGDRRRPYCPRTMPC